MASGRSGVGSCYCGAVKATPTEIPEVMRVRSPVHRDERGFLVETFRADGMAALGLPDRFEQENRSLSHQGVLRGLHFQERQAQGKLVTVLTGRIWDVAVDLRAGSPTRGRHVGLELGPDPGESLWIPPGFAHGFYVLEGPAVVVYKLTRAWAPGWDRCLAWDDPELAIPWPLAGPPLLSERDRRGMPWAQAPALPPEEP